MGITSTILRSRIIQKPYQLFHYYFLLEKSPNSTLSDLQFDTNISISINKFKNHTWTIKEVCHYGFLSSIILFVFIIFPASFLTKIPILASFILCFLIPLTSQFFVHALPIFTWLALFFSAGKIPTEWKPAISVKVLPAMETILYGDNLSNVLATITTPLLDILAWLPYGILHFSAPFVVAIFIFLFAPPTSLRSFGFAFGYMNLLGVLTQILFPAAAPWYKNLYDLQPANYTMKGSPGGLGRIDELLGFDMYTTAFSTSPVIFGAFPSLHSGCAIMDVFFLCWLFPKYKYVWWSYGTYLWWSTMYLTHHYFIDLIGGAILSLIVFEYTKYNHLPIVDANKFCRWSYSEVSKINVALIDPLSSNYINIPNDIEMQSSSQSQFDDNVTRFVNYPYLQQQPSIVPPTLQSQQQAEEFEMSSMAIPRSRQSSRSYLGTMAHGSSLNLPAHNEEDDEEDDDKHEEIVHEDNSSLENSATPSVFEDDHVRQISSATSTTSLDELDTTASIPPITSTKKNR
ncbi:Aureobasidin A resistance protein [Scheffersomyces coipomensis]|uniref:Aureobasidin A resistance protein n=1 Tax=Scheffersomyces coipomensis TaxID=1788519 RepID=UPI00315DEDE0